MFVGENVDHTKNAECAGGPYLVYEDPNSYVQVDYTSGAETGSGDMWKFGAEVWCNNQGRYTTIVADLKRLAGRSYEMSLCHLGIMGTKYGRSQEVESDVSLMVDE